jgi:ABC-2 type transport system ATP-binding protein
MVVTEDWTFRAEDVSKVYDGGNRANDGITMRVEPGEVYGLLGPNGAGKSTLVKQVIGLLKPTEGRITLGPYDLVAEPDAARQLCSYLPQAQMPIDSFRVHEAIELTGRIRGGDGAGVRRRLLWDQVRALGALGCAVFLVTHNVMEAEKSVDRLAIIAAGRLIAEGTPSSLKAEDHGQLRVQVMLVPGMGTPTLPEWVRHHTRVGHNLIAGIGQADGPRGIGWAEELIGEGVAEEYALGATTLEDVYIRLTGHVPASGHRVG